MARLVCIKDFENHALNSLPPKVRDYYKSGAGEEFSLKLNRDAFKKYVKFAFYYFSLSQLYKIVCFFLYIVVEQLTVVTMCPPQKKQNKKKLNDKNSLKSLINFTDIVISLKNSD